MGSQTAPPGGQTWNDTTAPPGGRYSNTSTAPLLSILGHLGSFRSVFGSLWGHLGRFGVVGGLTQLMQGAESQLHLMGTPPFQDPQQRPQNHPELWGHRRSCNTTGPPPILGTPPQPHIGDPPPIETPSAHIGIAPPF